MTHVDRIAFAIALAVIPVAAIAARADQTTVVETTRTGAPAAIVATPNPDASSMVIEYSRSYPASTSVAVYDKELFPKYSRRLELMLEQIIQGESKGMMNADKASQLRAEQGRLFDLARSVKSNGYPRTDLDNLEKQLTSFNAEIAHSMVHDTASAGATH